MPLPILQPTSAPTLETLVRLFHKTELRWTEHLAEEMQLTCGSAFCNPAIAHVWDANCLLDASLAENQSAQQAMEEVQNYFAAKGSKCKRWEMNPSAAAAQVDPFVAHLTASGFQRRANDIMYLAHMPAMKIEQAAGLKIIPARASFKHARAIAEESAATWNEPQLVEAQMMHLDDPHWDALLALKDQTAVAMLGVLAVGEIGRIDEVFVSKDFRGQKIGQTMMSRALEICARSLFKHVFLSCDANNFSAIALYKKLGFQKIGEIVSYFAP